MQTEANEASTETAETQEPQTTEAPQAPAPEGAQDAAGGAADDEGIEIDGQKFTSEADALAYARAQNEKIRTEKALLEAYQAGVTESRGYSAPAAPAPQQEEEDPDFDSKFYANPKAVLKEMKEKAKREAIAEMRAATQQTETEREVWNTFTELHPDLADFRADVEQIANSAEHRQIITALAQTKGQTEAMQYVAQKTRAKFQAYAAASKKTTVLPRGNGAGPSPSGTQKSVTPPKKEHKPLSMAEQVRQLRSKQRS